MASVTQAALEVVMINSLFLSTEVLQREHEDTLGQVRAIANLENARHLPTDTNLQMVGYGLPSLVFQPIHRPPLQPREHNSAIVVLPVGTRQNWAGHVVDTQWHGQFRLCQAPLLLASRCPCYLYQLDHCNSVFLRTAQTTDES